MDHAAVMEMKKNIYKLGLLSHPKACNAFWY